MAVRKLETLDDQQLIEHFASVAKALGSAVLDSENDRANRAIRRLWAVCDILRARGDGSLMKLAPLLDAADRFVRYYAAKQLLGVMPVRARTIIEWNHKYGFDALAGDAGMTLRDLDAGFYKPD